MPVHRALFPCAGSLKTTSKPSQTPLTVMIKEADMAPSLLDFPRQERSPTVKILKSARRRPPLIPPDVQEEREQVCEGRRVFGRRRVHQGHRGIHGEPHHLPSVWVVFGTHRLGVKAAVCSGQSSWKLGLECWKGCSSIRG
jgi:hypothetical protein